jgi:carboxypeptidase Taq
VFAGPHPVDAQRAVVLDVLGAIGFDPDGWRLDTAAHPFAQSLAPTDVRLTTRYREDDLGDALYSALHELGHGLYQAGVDPRLHRTPLGEPESLGLHESQSRLWENLVGRSRPFCAWLLPRLRAALPGFDGLDPDALFHAVNAVRPSLIRVDADETTYNLHIALRFELELALVEGALEVDALPGAFAEGMGRLLGVTPPDDALGVLQDVHWGEGIVGYFPTYSLGNVIAAQLWERVRADLPDLDERLERGDFAPLRAWLRERVHRHGRTFRAGELVERVTGGPIAVEPFLRYLRGRLEASGNVRSPS